MLSVQVWCTVGRRGWEKERLTLFLNRGTMRYPGWGDTRSRRMKLQKVRTILGHELSHNWMLLGPFGPDGYAYRSIVAPPGGSILRVIETRGDHGGHEWLHVSISHKESLPTWEEMKQVKHLFIGDERTAVQIFPCKEQWIN